MARTPFLAACLTACVLLPGVLHADGPLPTDPTVVAGDITITSPSATQLLVQQNGSAGIVDWGSFSIGAGYGVAIQNGAGATLNRVTGGDLSQIMGSLTATGSAYLVNQNGIIIGRDGAVNTGGRFIASALDIANSDFLNGGDNTFAGDTPAYVINLGQIASLGGDVSLMARNVVNAGSIAAPNGTVGLAAGREILMRDAAVADGMFAVRIGGADSSVSDSGAIRAAAAELRANGGNVYALAGNTTGTITATGVAKVKGRVFLTAGDTGKVTVDKAVKAANADGSGGAITVSGGTVDLPGRLDASGSTGGIVTVNSAIQTTFSGTVLAFGNGIAGSGGFAEISGHHLTFAGTVNTGGGSVLIDPDNIEITTGSAILLGASTMTPDSIIAMLGNQDVIIETTGTDVLAGVILVSNDVNYSSTHSLTLLAHGDILAYASLVNSSGQSGGDINLVAGWDGSTNITTFDPAPFDSADLISQTLFGVSSGASYTIIESTPAATGSVFIGDGYASNSVAVGSRNGSTRVYANTLVLTGSSNSSSYFGYAQLGYNISSSNNGVRGAISVRTTGDIDLMAGSAANAYAQIGHAGVYSSEGVATARVDAPITVETAGNLSLIANPASFNTYAMIGHGAVVGNTANGLRSGDITVTVGGEVSLQSAYELYHNPAWIGHRSNAFNGVTTANVLLTAAAFDLDGITRVGSGGLGTLDISMIGSLLQGGNVTVIATESGLNLINQTFGNCECNYITAPGDFLVQTAGDIHLDSSFFFSNLGRGNAILAAGGNFFNDTLGSGFGTMKDRWLVYSARPDQNLDDIGVMDANFIQFGTTFDPADPNAASLPSGNGLVYAVAPIVTVGPATMTYGGVLVPPSVVVTVNGDAVAADAFGFNLSDPRYTSQVTLSADGYANAGVYAKGLTVDRTAATAARVIGVRTVAGQLTVDRAVIGVQLADEEKLYDGTGLYTGTVTLTGFVGSDGAGLLTSGPDFGYSGGDNGGVNAGSYLVSASGLTESSGNYSFDLTDTATLTIDQVRLFAAITGNPTKTYDGTTAATLTAANFLLSGFIGTEGATVTQTAGLYASPDAAATNSVRTTLGASNFTANSGTLLANYVLPVNASGAGDITQAALTAAITGNPTKIYDGNTAAILTAGDFTLTGFATGQGAAVNQTAGSYASANASATNAVTAALSANDFAAGSGTDLSNYILPVSATGNGIVSRAALAATITGLPTKTYDGTVLATLTAQYFDLTGFVLGEGGSVTKTTGVYTTQNATVPNRVTANLTAADFAANSGTLLANYILPATASGTGLINRAVLSAVIVGNPTKLFDATTIASLSAANFSLSGFVLGEGATVTQTTGTYDTAELGSGKTITATLAPTDLTANVGTLLSNYILPLSASGTGSIAPPPPPVTIELTTRGVDAFSTTTLGEPTGPAPGLEVISTETTRQIIDEVNAGVAFCKQLVHPEYMVDCLSDRLQSVADGLSAVGEYSEVRRALEDAAQKLHALALANSGNLPQAVHRSSGRSSSRPLTAVSDATLARVNGQAAAIINSTELVLLRSSENSERRRVAFEQISQVVDSTKVLLRSS